MNSSKDNLRHESRQKRARQKAGQAEYEAARDLFFKTLSLSTLDVIAGYWPVGKEFDGTPILKEALSRGLSCALPVIREQGRVLDFMKWDEDTKLEKGTHGIWQPTGAPVLAPDIIIIPLLAFDRQGNRLGQGGGYYDATLAYWRDKKDILAVGLAYDDQACLSGLDVEAHDQPLDMVITPGGVFDFRI